MRNAPALFCFLTLAASSAWAADLPSVAPADAGFSAERLERIDQTLSGWVKEGKYSGVSAAIVRDGKFLYRESFGQRDRSTGAPMAEDTIFRIYSMTKPIVSTAVMMLHEQGRFLLDDPVSKYIPGFENVRVLADESRDGADAATVPLDREITIEHLLTHTSGLSNSAAYTRENVFDRGLLLEEMARRIVTVPLAHQPGRGWRYATSIDVLGRLIEIWSGKTLDVYLDQAIFEPLRMSDTGFWVAADKLSRTAKIDTLDESGRLVPFPRAADPGKKPAFLSGGGGLYSTVGDYARFAQMLLNEGELDGVRLLAPKTVRTMRMNHVAEDVLPENGPNGRVGYGFGYGGAVLMDVAASQQLASEGEYNWGGMAGTYFWIDPVERVIGLYFVQRPPFIPQPPKTFKTLVYQALVEPSR